MGAQTFPEPPDNDSLRWDRREWNQSWKNTNSLLEKKKILTWKKKNVIVKVQYFFFLSSKHHRSLLWIVHLCSVSRSVVCRFLEEYRTRLVHRRLYYINMWFVLWKWKGWNVSWICLFFLLPCSPSPFSISRSNEQASVQNW